MAGWIKLHRSISSHWSWSSEPFSKGQAWVDLILNAGHTDRKISIKNTIVELKRGQQARSEITLSKSWKWSRGKVRRFLGQLEKDGMIVQQSGHLTSIISICNYESFQGDGTIDGTSNGTSVGTTDGQQAVHKQECNNVNKVKEVNKYCDDFELLWKEYPRRKGGSNKKKTYSACLARIKEGCTWDEMIEGAKNYSAFCDKDGNTGTSFVKMASTFFGPDQHFLQRWSIGDDEDVSKVIAIYNDEVIKPFKPVELVIDDSRVSSTKSFFFLMNKDGEKVRSYFRYFFANANNWHKGDNQTGTPVSYDYIISKKTVQNAIEGSL